MLQWNSGDEEEKKGCLQVLALRGPMDNVAVEFWKKTWLLAGSSTEGASRQCCNEILEREMGCLQVLAQHGRDQ